MKSVLYPKHLAVVGSHPVRGAWIEIARETEPCRGIESHPVRGAWIEMQLWGRKNTLIRSRTP